MPIFLEMIATPVAIILGAYECHEETAMFISLNIVMKLNDNPMLLVTTSQNFHELQHLDIKYIT